VLDYLDVRCLWAFLTFNSIILNGVAFLKLASINLVDMHKQILATIIGLDKSKTFLIEETRYFTCCHNILP